MDVPKRTWGVGIALAGFVALTAVALLRPRQGVEGPASTSIKPAKPGSDACCVTDELASRASHLVSPPKAPAAAGPSARLLGRVLLPWPEKKKSEFAYTLYVLAADGGIEETKTLVNTDRFDLTILRPGRKALLFYPVLDSMTLASQVVVVPEHGDVDVVLKPQLPSLLEGRVVDGNGAGVGGLTVEAGEEWALSQELYLDGKPASAARIERTELPPAGSPGVSVTTVRIDPLAGRITRRVTSDSHGRFRLAISSPSDPLSVRVLRGKSEVIKEETVLPANGKVRIVVPNQ